MPLNKHKPKKLSHILPRTTNAIHNSSLSSIDDELNELFHRYHDIQWERLDREKYSKEIAKRLKVLYREESKPDFQQLKQIDQSIKKEKHVLSLLKMKKLLETAYEEKENSIYKKKLFTSTIKEKRDEILQGWKEVIQKKNQNDSIKLKEESEMRYSFIEMHRNREEKRKRSQWEAIQQMRSLSYKKIQEKKYMKKYIQKQELLKKINEEKSLKEKYDQYVSLCEEKKKTFIISKGTKFPMHS